MKKRHFPGLSFGRISLDFLGVTKDSPIRRFFDGLGGGGSCKRGFENVTCVSASVYATNLKVEINECFEHLQGVQVISKKLAT
jgi:hypothetical protein